MAAAFPHVQAKSDIILVVARSDGPLRDVDYAVADRLVEEVVAENTPKDGGESPILGVLSHQTDVVGEKLTSAIGPKGQASLIVLQLRSEFMAVANMPESGRDRQEELLGG